MRMQKGSWIGALVAAIQRVCDMKTPMELITCHQDQFCNCSLKRLIACL
jgi:hypothetical protein